MRWETLRGTRIEPEEPEQSVPPAAAPSWEFLYQINHNNDHIATASATIAQPESSAMKAIARTNQFYTSTVASDHKTFHSWIGPTPFHKDIGTRGSTGVLLYETMGMREATWKRSNIQGLVPLLIQQMARSLLIPSKWLKRNRIVKTLPCNLDRPGPEYSSPRIPSYPLVSGEYFSLPMTIDQYIHVNMADQAELKGTHQPKGLQGSPQVASWGRLGIAETNGGSGMGAGSEAAGGGSGRGWP
ncbi:hypothetical protein F5887DRAFT_919906 [Amanita rubescens]|nr:hypothetical protein F5887DRAFT_919906 [Amanita rubescens]